MAFVSSWAAFSTRLQRKRISADAVRDREGLVLAEPRAAAARRSGSAIRTVRLQIGEAPPSGSPAGRYVDVPPPTPQCEGATVVTKTIGDVQLSSCSEARVLSDPNLMCWR